MPFIGNQPALSYTSFAKQDFTTSATTSYTLDNPVTNENELALFINFVRQEPTTAYSASGTSLTLTSATSASDDMYCVFLGKAVQTVNPPSGSVGTAQLADSSVSLAKLSATGTKDSTTFLRGDNTFASAGGDNTPAFFAYKTSNQSISNTTTTKVTFESELVDSGSVYDTSNSRFTPAVAGYYIIGAKWRYDTSTNFSGAQFRVNRNGSVISKVTFVNDEASGMTFNQMFYSDADDYFEMFAYQNSGGSVTINGNSTYPEQDQAVFYAYRIIGI